MRISWVNIRELVKHELQQQEVDGRNVARLKQQWERIDVKAGKSTLFGKRVESFYSDLESWDVPAPLTKAEPSDFRSICSQASGFQGRREYSSPPRGDHYDKILGGWLGRSAGCLLGKPVEKITREGIRRLLESNGTWPLRDYITEEGIPLHLLKRYPWNRHGGRESLRENIVCMTEDDDMNYPMLNLYVAESFGRKFTTEDIAQMWMSALPVFSTFTAERVAYLNCLKGILPPETAVYHNPYREWIGARIRADVWGWLSPAQPGQAAALAWRDGRLSHIRNGLYGEMFFAAAIASSFTHNNLGDVIDDALKYIPTRSRLAEAIRFVLSMPMQNKTWDQIVSALYTKLGHYHWVHSINNSALVAAALLHSEGDYEQSICNVVMGGWDTDSNGATVGSILGTMLGAKRLPPKWIAPLNNRIRSSLKGFDNSSLDSLAQRTVRIVEDEPKRNRMKARHANESRHYKR